MDLRQSRKLEDVCYDIRGPVLEEAKRLEEEGRRIIKLNIGNPAPFGFDAPEEILVDVIRNLPESQGYSDSQGLLSARTAILHHYQALGVDTVDVDDIWLGNGVSELITLSLQAMLDDGDEVLVPAPDYPLWTASTSLAGGRPVHYLCDEASGWWPDIDDIRAKITLRTKAIVVINPNNPTGAVYPEGVLAQIADLARSHRLVVMADEIYDKVLYDDAVHIPFARLAPDVF
ncbi:MAG: aminotransferase class I/II-fold pyridoxal phosphate-dependent enzyme, partial [Pseudonocardiales bacterium]